MIASAIAFATASILCASCGIALNRRTCHRHSIDAGAGIQLIDSTLTLIQLLQKHRGLGSQQNGIAAAQRAQIASEIDHRWRCWRTSQDEIDCLHEEWQRLKQKPADFEGHSQLIKYLLGFIEVLASRFCNDDTTASSSIADRCRTLEDLARLRGLAARAAQFPHCPIELKVPLKYLCENLYASDLYRRNDILQKALLEINEHMLDANRTSISATRCFELLTPIIDNALEEIRHSIHALLLARRTYPRMVFASR